METQETEAREIALEENDALKLALLNERVSHARLVLATHQRELEALVLGIRQKYETEDRAVVGLDAGRGVAVTAPKST